MPKLTIEEFMVLNDKEKENYRCCIKYVGDYSIKVISGPSNFCNTCGDLLDKVIRLGSREPVYCFQCFRKNEVDAEFKND